MGEGPWRRGETIPLRHVQEGAVWFAEAATVVEDRPDRRWAWKDEDHFAHLQRFGWITPDSAAELRAEGERMTARIEARDPPFDDEWLTFRPDPAWPIPELPADWPAVPA